MSDIIYTPPASGGGGQNPTTNYIPLNNGTSNFVDSSIFNDLSNNYLHTEFNSVFGLEILDNGTSALAYLGDFNYNYNGAYILVYDTNRYIELNAGDNYTATSLILDDTSQIIRTRNAGNDIGLRLDFNNKYFALGDYNVNANGTSLIVDDVQTIIKTMFNGTDIGLNFSFPTRLFSFGDFNAYYGVQNYLQFDCNNNLTILENGNGKLYLGDYLGNYQGTLLTISDASERIFTNNILGVQGIDLDLSSNNYFFGDFNSISNGTYIWVKDSTKAIELVTNGGEIINTCDLLIFSGNLTSLSAGGPSPLGHLQVTINGTPCKIQLLNP